MNIRKCLKCSLTSIIKNNICPFCSHYEMVPIPSTRKNIVEAELLSVFQKITRDIIEDEKAGRIQL